MSDELGEKISFFVEYKANTNTKFDQILKTCMTTHEYYTFNFMKIFETCFFLSFVQVFP